MSGSPCGQNSSPGGQSGCLDCRDDHEVMLSGHVPAEMFANEHYADQLVERMGWVLVDAEYQEQAIRA